MSDILGFTFALLLAVSMLPSLSSYLQKANENKRAVATAEQHKKLIDASSQYIKQYHFNLQTIATATTPAKVTVPMLKTVNLLDISFNSVNPFGQTWETQVLQPSAGNLKAFVMSYGGTALDDKTASKIAGLVGQAGGLIPKKRLRHLSRWGRQCLRRVWWLDRTNFSIHLDYRWAFSSACQFQQWPAQQQLSLPKRRPRPAATQSDGYRPRLEQQQHQPCCDDQHKPCQRYSRQSYHD